MNCGYNAIDISPIKEDSGSGGGLGGPFMPQVETIKPIVIIKKITINFFTTPSCVFIQSQISQFKQKVFNQTLKTKAS